MLGQVIGMDSFKSVPFLYPHIFNIIYCNLKYIIFLLVFIELFGRKQLIFLVHYHHIIIEQT